MTVRVAVIGATGHIGYVTEGIRELGDARICAIAPGGPEERIETVRARVHAGADVAEYMDYRDLLDREAPDVVAVSPRFHRHAEITCAALDHGFPVYCEKPLALTLESLDSVRTAQRNTGVAVGIMLDFRYAPAFSTARALWPPVRSARSPWDTPRNHTNAAIVLSFTNDASRLGGLSRGSGFTLSTGCVGSAAGTSQRSKPATQNCFIRSTRKWRTPPRACSRRTMAAARL